MMADAKFAIPKLNGVNWKTLKMNLEDWNLEDLEGETSESASARIFVARHREPHSTRISYVCDVEK